MSNIKYLLLLFFLEINLTSYCQSLTFSYDASGNRITKTITGNLPVITFIGDTMLCPGDSTTINASGGVSYSWSTGNSTSTINVHPANSFTYSVTVTGSNGCTSQKAVNVIVNPKPNTSSITGVTITQVFNIDNYSVVNTPGSTYYWSAVGGSVLPGSTNTAQIYWTTIGLDTVKVVEINQYGCAGDTIRIPVNVTPVGINEVKSANASMSIFPNPSGGNVMIQFTLSGQSKVKLNILDKVGAIVNQMEEKNLSAGIYEYQVGATAPEINLASGIYYAQLIVNNQTLNKKIIIIK